MILNCVLSILIIMTYVNKFMLRIFMLSFMLRWNILLFWVNNKNVIKKFEQQSKAFNEICSVFMEYWDKVVLHSAIKWGVISKYERLVVCLNYVKNKHECTNLFTVSWNVWILSKYEKLLILCKKNECERNSWVQECFG